MVRLPRIVCQISHGDEMNRLTDPVHSPGAVTTITDVHPDHLRDWRRRDILNMIGTADENGRWKYSLRDVVAIWIGLRLSQHGRSMPLAEAFRYGAAMAGSVIVRFLHRDAGIPSTAGRYFVTLADGFVQDGKAYGMTTMRVADLSELAGREFDLMTVLDAERLAATIPPQIAGFLLVAAENQYGDMGLDRLTEGLDA